ncbi:MAG: hypothetical protein U9P70_02970, partial [Patescibacteria group bacterium]|nr:hypothetical protein [Patescibacteria group bacterium]
MWVRVLLVCWLHSPAGLWSLFAIVCCPPASQCGAGSGLWSLNARFFKFLFTKFEITKGSTALSGLWSQRCSTNIKFEITKGSTALSGLWSQRC